MVSFESPSSVKTSDMSGFFGNRARPRRPCGIVPEHPAVILDRGAATGCVDDDGVDGAVHLLGLFPRRNVAPGRIVTCFLKTHVVHQCTATADAVGDHHLAAEPIEEPHRGFVDGRPQNLLRASGQKRDAHPRLPFRVVDLRMIDRIGPSDVRRRQVQHGAETPRHQPAERPAQRRAQQRQPEHPGIRQHTRQHPAEHAVRQRPGIGLFDIGTAVIDQVHVIDAGRTGRHARQTREAAIKMLGELGRRRLAALERLLHQVDAAARAVQFITLQYISRACRRTEAAVHTFPENVVGGLDVRVGQLRDRKVGLHGALRSLDTSGPGSAHPRGRSLP